MNTPSGKVKVREGWILPGKVTCLQFLIRPEGEWMLDICTLFMIEIVTGLQRRSRISNIQSTFFLLE